MTEPMSPERLAEIRTAVEHGMAMNHDATDLLAEVERLQGLVGDCVCGPWHPGTDGPLEDCPQHGRRYAYWVDGVTVRQARIDAALSVCDDRASEILDAAPRSAKLPESATVSIAAVRRALRGDE